MTASIRLAVSTDLRGFGPVATVVASVLRRATVRVEVRVYCRGFEVEGFGGEWGRVEFVRCEGGEGDAGHYPGHVSAAVFDRLRVMEEARDRVAA